MPRHFILILLLLAFLMSACTASQNYKDADLYSGFTRLDPDRQKRVEDAWLIVRDGTIVEMGQGTPPQGDFAERYDMSGLYGLPGLIDGHAHITAGPHKLEVVDGAPRVTIESVDAITEFHAKIAIGFGVTTVRNPGGDPVANAAYDEKVASGEWIGPQALHAGAVIQPPPFTGAAFAYPKSPEEWDREAARQADLGMTYFKLYTSLTEEELGEGVRAAKAHGLIPIAHLDAVSWTKAADLGVEIMEHALPTSPDLIEPDQREAYLKDASYGLSSKPAYVWFEMVDYDGPLFTEMVRALKDHGVALNLTLSVNELIYNTDDLSGVLLEEDAKFTHPESLTAMKQFLAGAAYGWTPEDYERARTVWPRVHEFVQRLETAGIPMMIGTDSNSGGVYMAHEMALHIDAGLDAWTVLDMATGGAADIMGLGDSTGRLAPGYEADIVFLSADPLTDMSAIRKVVHVVTDGMSHDAAAVRESALSSLN
ncbi:hypothetical protein DX908_12500 [Parvularcula marina]|uniref:Amidohydrolase-related domain-containing protein n=2 Tax=Parvularcula marina TaxID=2292771 RepID=A0A371RKL8_9PROT|nr:hypothetical protein DX908_12500 [Parvularcula marina]